MKRIFLLFAFAFFALASCRKENVTQVVNPQQAIGITYTITPAAWQTSDNELSYAASLEVPELTNPIYDHGAVLVYISFGTDYYEALPEVFNGIAFGALHSPGYVTIDFHALDGGSVAPPEEDVNIKVVLIDAEKVAMHPDVDLKNFKEVQNVFLK